MNDVDRQGETLPGALLPGDRVVVDACAPTGERACEAIPAPNATRVVAHPAG
jgi:hypothetical protein